MMEWGKAAQTLWVVAILALSGCGLDSKQLGSAQVLVTNADKRMTTVTPVMPGASYDAVTGVRPSQIVCAEPSPDVAKAVSQSFAAGGSLEVQGGPPQSPSGEAAASLSRTRAEALAQLTARLATIQLLRDGLYRLCEAYGNGAMNHIEYALVLSRFGDTMVTMLASELATGNFGQPLAALGTSANGSAQAAVARAQQDAVKAQVTQGQAESAQADVDAKQKDADAAAKAAATAPDPQNKAALQATATQKAQTLQDARGKLLSLRAQSVSDKKAAADSATTANIISAVGGITTSKDTDKAVDAVVAMQRTYLASPNLNALMVACITALDRADTSQTPFAQSCEGPQGLMAQIALSTSAIIQASIGREDELARQRRLKADVDRVKAEREILGGLDDGKQSGRVAGTGVSATR